MRPGIYYKNVTWDDAPHLDHAQRAALEASYPAHMRDARTRGVPMLGSGAVYPILQNEIEIDQFEIPSYFYRLTGIDFGIDHPAAGVWLAWHKDADTLYVYDCYKKAGETPVYHGRALKKHGDWIPIAWPHDGINRDKGSGRPLYKLYRAEGLRMMKDSARYEDDIGGGQGSEPAVIEILERMRTGRFKVFRHLSPWFEEFRTYHRKNGIIVPANDDLMKATHYAVMMKRKAEVKGVEKRMKPQYSEPIIKGLGG